jgi:hypothetical protein
MMQSLLPAQSPRIKMSPRSSLLLLRLLRKSRRFAELSLFSSSDFTSVLQQAWILGSLRIACGWGKDLGSKVTQFVSDLIVTGDDGETAFFALNCMTHTELLVATSITKWWWVGRTPWCMPQKQSITELLSRKLLHRSLPMGAPTATDQSLDLGGWSYDHHGKASR